MYKRSFFVISFLTMCCIAEGKNTSTSITYRKTASLTKSQHYKSGFVTAIIAPAINYVDWSNPRALIKTFGIGGVKKSLAKTLMNLKGTSMGHGMAQVSCTGTDGKKHDFMTGMVGTEDIDMYKDAVFKDGLGMRVLFDAFDDGYLQDTEDVKNYIANFRGRKIHDTKLNKKRLNDVRYLRFAINSQQCDDAVDFYNTFKSISFMQPKDRNLRRSIAPEQSLYYGLLLEPYDLYLQHKVGAQVKLGGGCTSVMTAFLRSTGVYERLDSNFLDEKFYKQLIVGRHLLGGYDEVENTNRKVPLQKYFFSKLGSSWGADTPYAYNLKWYDPEQIWRFFDGAYECQQVIEGRMSMEEVHDTCTPEIMDWLSKNSYKGNTYDFLYFKDHNGKDRHVNGVTFY